jgi:hypothetical protein
MSSKWTIRLCAGALFALAAVAAAQPAQAQIFLNEPDFRRGAIEPNDPLVGIPLPGATAAEYRASILWNLRSGLNVAALQCQFSPYLRAVANYNALLAHHATELANAYTTLDRYFRRVAGATAGPRRFDDYSTQTYNNFSTLQAQMGFCQTATNISKEALTIPKGELHTIAASRMRELRNSLVPFVDRPPSRNPFVLPPLSPISLADPCASLRGRQLRRCQSGAR